MDALELGLRLLLAIVFVTAAVAKLLDLRGSRQAVEDFGVPAPLARILGALVPLGELAVAVALVPSPSAQWGAAGALALVAAFSGGIANAMARGRSPDCHCFGQLHSTPAGRGTLARNAVLAAFAIVVVVAGPGPAIDDWVSARSAAELLAVGLGILAIGFAASTLLLWRDNRRLRGGSGGDYRPLPVGAPAPWFRVDDLKGRSWTLDSLLAPGKTLLLVIVDRGCDPCRLLLPDLARWERSLSDHLTFALITHGPREENEALVRDHPLEHVLLQRSSEVFQAYHATATPTAVAVSPDGTIASPPTAGALAIEALVRLLLKRDAVEEPASPARTANVL